MPILSSLSLVRYGSAKSEATHSRATFFEVVGRSLRCPQLTVFVFILPHYSLIVTKEVVHVDVLSKLLSIRLLVLRLLHRDSSERWKWKLGDT